MGCRSGRSLQGGWDTRDRVILTLIHREAREELVNVVMRVSDGQVTHI
jgi:hypothetical protein